MNAPIDTTAIKAKATHGARYRETINIQDTD
jgi:hypothetical protein